MSELICPVCNDGSEKVMSHVTNVILKTLDEEEKAIEEINHYLRNETRRSELILHPHDMCAGTKCLECDLYIGAFNSLDVDEFISVVKGADWQDIDTVQLLICEQEEDLFTDRLR